MAANMEQIKSALEQAKQAVDSAMQAMEGEGATEEGSTDMNADDMAAEVPAAEEESGIPVPGEAKPSNPLSGPRKVSMKDYMKG